MANQTPNPILPGIDVLESGFDIVLGDSRGQIFDFPQGTKQLREYVYPHLVVQCKQTIERQKESKVFKNAEEYERYIAAELKLDFIPGMLSSGGALKRVKSEKRDQTLAFSSETVTLYTLATNSSIEDLQPLLTASFKKQVDALPDQYSSTAYRSFMDLYGTHFLRELTMGGEMWVERTYQTTTTESDVNIQAELQALLGKITASSKIQIGYSENASNSIMRTEFQHRGGDVTTQDVSQWNNSLWSSPFYFPKRLVSLADLLPENKKTHFQTAVTQYLEEALMRVVPPKDKVDVPTDAVLIKSKHCGFYLTVKDDICAGSLLCVSGRNYSNKQHWRINKETQMIENAEKPNLVIGIDKKIILDDLILVDKQSPNEKLKWDIDQSGGIINSKTRQAFDVLHSKTTDNTQVIAYKHHSGTNQQWQIKPVPQSLSNPSGPIPWGTIKNTAFRNHTLDIQYNKCHHGASVILYTTNSGANQLWRFNSKGYIKSKADHTLVLDYVEKKGKMKLIVSKKDSKQQSQRWALGSDGFITNLGCKLVLTNAKKESLIFQKVEFQTKQQDDTNQRWEFPVTWCNLKTHTDSSS